MAWRWASILVSFLDAQSANVVVRFSLEQSDRRFRVLEGEVELFDLDFAALVDSTCSSSTMLDETLFGECRRLCAKTAILAVFLWNSCFGAEFLSFWARNALLGPKGQNRKRDQKVNVGQNVPLRAPGFPDSGPERIRGRGKQNM